MIRKILGGLLLTSLSSAIVSAHDTHSDTADALSASARYIANEGVMVENGDVKILFDPLPLSGFGTYPEPTPLEMNQIINGSGPYAGVDAVFISHAHRDHFSASRMIEMMSKQQALRLIAPMQALDMMKDDPLWEADLRLRIIALDMEPAEAAKTIDLPNLSVTALRIPHAGWPAPARASVQNMVYRVSLGAPDINNAATVMHMGDADPRRQHFLPHAKTWDAVTTDTAFPPYWFFTSEEGRMILDSDINATTSVGVHVPIDIPQGLKDSGQPYFSIPGERRDVKTVAEK